LKTDPSAIFWSRCGGIFKHL